MIKKNLSAKPTVVDLSAADMNAVRGGGALWDVWADIKKIHADLVDIISDTICDATDSCHGSVTDPSPSDDS